MTDSKPKIVVLSCNWSGLSCIETAIGSGDTYSSSVRVVRVTCLSRIHAGLMLKAFEFGASGVMLLGCEPDQCHFDSDKGQILREVEKAHDILAMLGIGKERLALVQFPAFSGRDFTKRLNQFSDEIQNMSINV
jgi:F420-non-reducing hydrogenase iron-sulfur subunit